MPVLFMVWASLTTYGQNVGYQVDVDNITYTITSTAPTEVEVAGYTGTKKEVTILETVNHDGTGYDITAIGERAFDNVVLTEVTIPNGVTSVKLSLK